MTQIWDLLYLWIAHGGQGKHCCEHFYKKNLPNINTVKNPLCHHSKTITNTSKSIYGIVLFLVLCLIVMQLKADIILMLFNDQYFENLANTFF
jgi:hypothetical protein